MLVLIALFCFYLAFFVLGKLAKENAAFAILVILFAALGCGILNAM